MAALKRLARAFMDDLHDFCSVGLSAPRLDERRSSFNLSVREFRRERPWLIRDLGEGDDHGRTVTDDATLFYSLRTSPGGAEQVLFVANMEGDPVEVTPADLPLEGLSKADGGEWQLAPRRAGGAFRTRRRARHPSGQSRRRFDALHLGRSFTKDLL